MENTNRTEIRFRPASRDEIGHRAKAVSRWLGLKHTEAIRYLAGLYGYENVRALQAATDEVERGITAAAAGPYRGDDGMGEQVVASHIEATMKRFLALGAGDRLLKAGSLSKCGLYSPIAEHRHACQWAEEFFVMCRKDLSKAIVEKLSEPVRRRVTPKGKVFHEWRHGDRFFYGAVLGSDLYLGDEFGHWAYIGPSVSHYVKKAGVIAHRFCGAGWYVCKYNASETKLPLEGFDEADAKALGAEFGMLVGYGAGFPVFYNSPAARGLQRWVGAHRVSARRHGPSANYLRNWHEVLAPEAVR